MLFQIGNIWDHDAGFLFFGVIDGVHCPIEEPHPFDPANSSHKLGGSPGVNYELVTCVHKPMLAWVYGPIAPGTYNDISTFRRRLKWAMEDKLPGRRLIGDKGYRGEQDLISTKNEFDPEELAEFKDRCCARHETFNQRLKVFHCLSTPWRHGRDNHGIAFEACCAIVMFQIKTGGTSFFDPYP